MATFKARTTAPSKTDKNYLHTSYGGYNPCIHISGGSVLSNCVGYAWGRMRELLGNSHNLSRGNAEVWFGNTKDGYKRGQTPKLGAVMCWKKGSTSTGSDGYGHVAIVEEIKSNGDVVVSESVYGGVRWRTITFTKVSDYYLGKGYEFQGFIYPPVEFEKAHSYKPGDYEVTCDVLNVRAGAGTSFAKKTFSQLTVNAQKQIKELNNGRMANGYVKGVQCTVSQVKNNWGKTPSGWICLDYCKRL